MEKYSQEDIDGFHAKDMRISFLSLFSSIKKENMSNSLAMDEAFKINEELYKKYPFVTKQIPTGEPTGWTKSPIQSQKPTRSPNIASGSDIKGKSCPVCGSMGLRNDAGKLKNAKAPDYKCSKKGCKFSWSKQTRQYEPSEYITGWWESKDEDIARANHQDAQDDEAAHIPVIQENEYGVQY